MDYNDDSQPSQDSVMTVVDEDRQEVLYFAYGCDLSTDAMRQRCPYSTPIGLGHLEGWRWTINKHGNANIVLATTLNSTANTSIQDESYAGSAKTHVASSEEGRGVYGLLYLLPSLDEDRLDEFEGVPGSRQKFQADVRWVRNGQGQAVNEGLRALIYVDVEPMRQDNGTPRNEVEVLKDSGSYERTEILERGISDAVDNWGMDETYAKAIMETLRLTSSTTDRQD
jgi:hypothetical protein